jgi:hypothetical protein
VGEQPILKLTKLIAMADLTESNKRSFWEFKKYQEHEWFRFLVQILMVISVFYMVLHPVINFYDPDAGYEYSKLDKEQLQHINRIYFDQANTTQNPQVTTVANQQVDTTRVKSDSGVLSKAKTPTSITIDTLKNAKVIRFISGQFNDKVNKTDLNNAHDYINLSLPLESLNYLSTTRFRVQSYFWLVGPEVYFEIIFWSWFGVIASILFSLAVVIRNRTTDIDNEQTVFDSSEIPHQFAKLFYAPLCTLAIILGYNYFADQNITDISSSKGVIAFAFLGGFYSSRMISFLDRLKEVILPNSSTAEMPVQPPSRGVPLSNVTIELKPDADTLTAELISELSEVGMGEAEVMVVNDENGESVKAERAAADQTMQFVVASLKPGNYTINASWSREIAGEPVNLKGSEKVAIKNTDSAIGVVMKKDDSAG